MRSTRGFAVFTTLVRLSVLAVLAAMLSATSSVRAATITETTAISANAMYDNPAPGYLAPFNPADGTLTDVTLNFSGIYNGGVAYYAAIPPYPATADVTTSVSLYPFFFPGLSFTAMNVPYVQFGGGIGYGATGTWDDTLDFTGPQLTQFESGDCGPAQCVYFSLAVGSLARTGTGVNGGDAEDETTATGYVTLTYDYVVPEPSSFALMLAGLFCLWGVRRISKA